nr:ABC transporter substrate-binding protein [Amycolatopsis umgeniensis]
MIGRLCWEFLTPPSPVDYKPTSGVAESLTPSEDKLTWKCVIRQGLTWSDGTPLTAHDVAFTFDKIMSDEVAAEANGSYVENIVSVEAEGDDTVWFRTKSPQASMTALDVPIVPEHVWRVVEDMDDPLGESVEIVGVGSGPFLVAEHRKDDVTILKANPGYWRGRSAIDEIHLIFFESADDAVDALCAGEVDVVNRVTFTQHRKLSATDGVTVVEADSRRYNHLMLNLGALNRDRQPIGDGHPALRDIRVRKALAKAIDVEAIRDGVYGGFSRAPGGIVPAVFPDYHWEPSEEQRYEFDLTRAGEELEAAGYRLREGRRVGPDGDPLRLRLLWRLGTDYHERAAKHIAGWLDELGIGVESTGLPDDDYEEEYNSGRFDLTVAGWGSPPDPDWILSRQTSKSLPSDRDTTVSASFLADDEFDALYERQLAEMDPAARAEIVKQAQARYYDLVPTILLAYPVALEAYRSDRFTGFTRQPAGTGPIMEQAGYWGFYTSRPVG